MDAAIVCATGFCVTVTCLCYTDTLTWLKKKFECTVQCWFCHEKTRVRYIDSNSWTCQSCGQYNGFNKDGDYNRDITSMYDARYNRVTTRPKAEFKRTNTLCAKCNYNQELKIKQIANFVPINQNNYDKEINYFKEQIEESYKLCRDCERLVSSIISSSLFSGPRRLSLRSHKLVAKCYWTMYLSIVVSVLLICHWLLSLYPPPELDPVLIEYACEPLTYQVLSGLGVVVHTLQCYLVGTYWCGVVWLAWSVIASCPYLLADQPTNYITYLQVVMTCCFLLSTFIILLRRKRFEWALRLRVNQKQGNGSISPASASNTSVASASNASVASANYARSDIGSNASCRSVCNDSYSTARSDINTSFASARPGNAAKSSYGSTVASRTRSATATSANTSWSANNSTQYYASDISDNVSPRFSESPGKPDSPVRLTSSCTPTSDSKPNLMKPLAQLPRNSDLDISSLSISSRNHQSAPWSKTNWNKFTESGTLWEGTEKLASPWDRVSLTRSSSFSLRSSPCSFKSSKNILSPGLLSNTSDDWLKSPSAEKEPYFKRLNDPWTPNPYDNLDYKRAVYPYPVLYSWSPPPSAWEQSVTSTPNSTNPPKQETTDKQSTGIFVSHLPTIILAATNAFLVYYILNLKS